MSEGPAALLLSYAKQYCRYGKEVAMLANKTDAAFLDVATETATSVALVLVPVATSTFGPPAVLALVHANNLTAQKNPPHPPRC